MLLPDEDAIAVLLPDDLVLPTGVLETMSKVRAKRGGSVLCAIEVPADEISAYGVFDVEVVPDAVNPNVLKVKGMVEKPKAEDAPSLFAAAGRYVLDRAIFDALRRVQKGVGGEIQLTDAIALLIEEGHPVHVVVHRGCRHDLGNPGGYLKAAVDFALERDDYGPELRRWLVERLGLERTRTELTRVRPLRLEKGALCVRWRSSRPGWRPPRWRHDRCEWRSPRRRV